MLTDGRTRTPFNPRPERHPGGVEPLLEAAWQEET